MKGERKKIRKGFDVYETCIRKKTLGLRESRSETRSSATVGVLATLSQINEWMQASSKLTLKMSAALFMYWRQTRV